LNKPIEIIYQYDELGDELNVLDFEKQQFYSISFMQSR